MIANQREREGEGERMARFSTYVERGDTEERAPAAQHGNPWNSSINHGHVLRYDRCKASLVVSINDNVPRP